ncbi:unnamed protein product [Acanthoscelides obtectus]|uniref:cAMP-regulated phosphoprotein 21 n=2 Tax=Acanthoscelides obtectus TaxID=200917 RepID=A0A9P0PDT2_ACAOB|nr:unnamed protein product [Acanthoscelides obtectus]CAK1667653.1 Protein encore [Acanthoscelides obtectus]
MDAKESDGITLPSRSRHHSTNKMKVLVRSHAMREESPPPSQHDSPPHHKQPCIKLIPSPEPGGGTPDGGGGGCVSPVVVLSPSPSPAELTQQQQQCLSPAGTLVPSSPASRGSPNGHLHPAGVEEHTDESEMSTTKYANNTATKLPPTTNNNRYHHNQHYNQHYHQQQYQQQQPPPPFFPPKQSSQPTNYRGPNTGGGGTRKPGHIPSHNACDNNNTVTAVNNNNNVSGGGNNMLTVQRARGKLRQQSSSQGSFESSYNSPCLSRDSSSEQYTDTTGIDLEQFIPETLNKNSRDRALMLRIEQELVNLAKDKFKTHYKFPPMCSYQRMLIHRCAAYFGMDHNIETTGGKSVIVNKTKNTRIPETEFKELIRDDIILNDEPRRSILKRDSNSIEDYSFKSPDRSCSSENRRSKSFEEREEEYEKARRRIFNREQMHDGSSEDFGWSEMPWSSTESEYSSRFRLHPPDYHRRHFGKLIKVHSEDTAETLRPYVAKSYSFGGYGGSISVLSRGDSVMSTHSAGPRLLTKQDSAASSVSWRLSPSSSGYKSQSQMSESVTPSPTSTPHQGAGPQIGVGAGPPQPQMLEGEEVPAALRKCGHRDSHIVWAVTDIHNVPLGSLIIDPETGKPLKNDDGSAYHYDPNNLPPLLVHNPSKPESSQAPPSSPPKQSTNENPTPSPKKNRQIKSSPTRRSTVTNSSTSPSLPFTPPPQQVVAQTPSIPPPLQRSFGYADQQQQQLTGGGYTTAYAAPPMENGVYAQSYVVYAPSPYGMHMAAQYDARMEAAQGVPTDMTTYYVQDGAGGVTSYPPGTAPPYWHHQPVACFYQNGQPGAAAGQLMAPPPGTQHTPRYVGHSQAFLPPSAGTYPASYVSPPSAAQQAIAAQPQTPELVPVYPSYQQVIYHQNQQHPTAIYPQSQSQVVYAASQANAAPPIYPSPPVPPVPHGSAGGHMVPTGGATAPPYPQGTPTPNAQSQQDAANAAAYAQLAHVMQHMSIAGAPAHYQHTAATAMMMQQQQHNTKVGQMEYRTRPASQQYFNTKSNGKYLSRQSSVGNGGSSGGTNSPATTVVAIPPSVAMPGYYKTPPDTPPAAQGILPPHFTGFVPPHPGAGMFSMPPGPPPPVLFKQMGSMRMNTPGTARSSRSPTPASEMSHLERQRMSFPPPNIFQGMPYVVPSDPRLMSTRNQPNVYKQTSSVNKNQNFSQNADSRPHKNKKNKYALKNRKSRDHDFLFFRSKGNKQSGLPPSGK